MKAFRRPTVLVLLVAIAVAACSSSGDAVTTAPTTTTTGSATPPETTAAPTTLEESGAPRVTINDFSFNPGDVTVTAGSTVTWNNGDGVSHTTTSDDDVWDSGPLSPGDTFGVVLDEPGVYAYHCNIHRTMTGTITVEG
jgi:plastocyanin